MESLDLVITSDTAIAHLAGALGRPVSRPETASGLALDDAARRIALVSDHAAFPSEGAATNGRLFSRRSQPRSKRAFEPRRPCDVESRRDCRGSVAAAVAPIAIPGAIGELVDKITILEIKESQVDDAPKLRNIRFELSLLLKLKAEAGFSGAELDRIEAELKRANEVLWNAENALRGFEARRQFDEEFISLAGSSTPPMISGPRSKSRSICCSIQPSSKKNPTPAHREIEAGERVAFPDGSLDGLAMDRLRVEERR